MKEYEKEIHEYGDLNYSLMDKDVCIKKWNRLDEITQTIMQDIHDLKEINSFYYDYSRFFQPFNIKQINIEKQFTKIEDQTFLKLVSELREYNELMKCLKRNNKYTKIFNNINNKYFFVKKIISKKTHTKISHLLHNSSYFTSNKKEKYNKNNQFLNNLLMEIINRTKLEELEIEFWTQIKEFRNTDKINHNYEWIKKYDTHPVKKLLEAIMEIFSKFTGHTK